MADRHALVVSYHVPQADRDSGARRVFHMMELLREASWEVTFLASDGVGEARDVRVLQQMGVAVYDGQKVAFDEVLAGGPYDLALIAFWLNAERYLPTIRASAPRTRVIVDSVDLHFVRESRKAFLDARSGRPGGLTSGMAARIAGELNTYVAADAVLTVSDAEASLVGTLTGDTGLARSVVDCEDVPVSPVPFEQRSGIVSVGSFQHLPNVEAVEFLCRSILPLVPRSTRQEHQVWIVGNAMTDEVRAFADGLSFVRMVGWVPSVFPYLERARVSVVPLLHGAGTKRKLVQALATGTPTVSTSVGVEGLGLRHREHVMIADDPVAFARAVEELLNDSDLWHRLARAGRARVLETNGRDVTRRQLSGVIDAVLAAPARRSSPISTLNPERRMTQDQYADLVDSVRLTASSVISAGAKVLVVTRGDSDLVALDQLHAAHFPQAPDGRWAGHHPANANEAIHQLEALRRDGAQFLVLPRTSFWWLDFYTTFSEHLAAHYERVHEDGSCIVFSLGTPEAPADLPRPMRITVPAAPDRADGVRRLDVSDAVRVIAFYLPQFHPIRENDDWWGPGFSEWRSVARADPLFEGHYQPHIPADLGFYDLRLPETRQRQAELAAAHGIHGFCYYHYWFRGKRLLERPFDEVLAGGAPDFPFALCWANDPWTRRWDGREDDLLQAQAYSPEDDVDHIRALLPALADPRAIRIDGRPVFLVYRATHLPNATRTCDVWREEVARAGLPGIYLIAVETAWDLGWDATASGFDAKVLFQPQFGWLMTRASEEGARIAVPGRPDLQVYDYDAVRAALREMAPVPYRRFESVFPSWDNSARVGERAVVMHNATPAGYQQWLTEAVQRAAAEPRADERIVFVNAWNEWAEGCHLEPDARHGHAYLEATRAAVASTAPLRAVS